MNEEEPDLRSLDSKYWPQAGSELKRNQTLEYSEVCVDSRQYRVRLRLGLSEEENKLDCPVDSPCGSLFSGESGV